MDFKIGFLSVFITIFIVLSIYYLFKEIEEIIFLKKTLKRIISRKKILEKTDLVKIKNFLNSSILYDSNKKKERRPILRHSATHILKSKYGFCGENARLAIKLLTLGNIKSNRIYLHGKKWGHVVTENFWNNEWYLFDGHYDPLTSMKDYEVLNIKSIELKKYPNGYKENEYQDFSRIKLFKIFKPLHFASKYRLPMVLIYLFESPYLIKFLLSMIAISIGILLLNII